jgi:hypothetical protein
MFAAAPRSSQAEDGGMLAMRSARRTDHGKDLPSCLSAAVVAGRQVGTQSPTSVGLLLVRMYIDATELTRFPPPRTNTISS